jgi:hypothetical protein
MMLGDYKENDPFSILHSWKILGNEQKWNAKVQELSRPCKQAGGVKNHEVELGDDNGSPTQRPEGRDQQNKKKRGIRDQERVQYQLLQLKCCKGWVRTEVGFRKRRKSTTEKSLPAKMKKINLQKQMLQVHMKEVDIWEKEYNSWTRIWSSSHCSRDIYHGDGLGEGPFLSKCDVRDSRVALLMHDQ